MKRRPGYTLIELLVAMGSATVLMAGLSSALYVSSRALELDNGGSARRVTTDGAVARVLADARTAIRFREVSPMAIEFDVPDRTGDGAADKVRYAWGGVAGNPLTRSINGAAALEVVKDVRALAFAGASRAVAAPNVVAAPLTTWPLLWHASDPVLVVASTSITLPAAPKVAPGDLLLAVLAMTGDPATVTLAGWNELHVVRNGNNDKLRLSVWTKTASNDGPANYSVTWPGAQDAFAGLMVLSNHHATTPVAAAGIASAFDNSNSPPCPAATVDAAGSLVLRVGAFAKDSINTDGVTGLAGHTNLWARNVSNRLAAGCGYALPVAAGSTGTASFVLKNTEGYTTMTVVVTPRAPVGP